jgi:hypothetical protein
MITITAKTQTGTNVTVTSFDVLIEDGKPLIMFFTKDNNGQFAIYSQNMLTDYQEHST